MTNFRVGGISVRFLIICLFLNVTRHLECHLGHNQCTINIDGKRNRNRKGEKEGVEARLNVSLRTWTGKCDHHCWSLEQPP